MSQLIYLHKSTEEDQHGAYIGKTITLEYLQFCVLISPQILDIWEGYLKLLNKTKLSYKDNPKLPSTI